MEENDHLEKINRRNTLAFEQALKDITARLHEVMGVVASQQQAIGSLINRQNELEQKINVQKVQLTGLGPSVRE
jgi:PP-loop superfamily ATP-utilizing enzyme